jgi:hypothetical protein
VSIGRLSLFKHCQCCQLADISVRILILLRKKDRPNGKYLWCFLSFLLQKQNIFSLLKTVKTILAEYEVQLDDIFFFLQQPAFFSQPG